MTPNSNDSSAHRSAVPDVDSRLTRIGKQGIFARAMQLPLLQKVAAAPINWKRRHWMLAGVVVTCIVCVGVVVPKRAAAMRQDMPVTTLDVPIPQLPADEALTAALDAQNADPLGVDANWQVVSVRSGQNLGDIFQQQGLSATDLQRLLGDRNNASALRNIHPGDEFAFARGSDGSLRAIRFDRDDHTRVIVGFTRDGLHQDIVDRQIERRTHVAHGVVNSNLFSAGKDAGMNDTMVIKLADAFGYDIDFAQDLRIGDSFTVIYDDVFREGERLRDGDIIAATFVNRGRRFSAVRFTNAAGETMFYTDDGRPLRKTFLKTPVDFTRITSLFSTARMHPILGLMRAHQGVDYAAPTGTPVRAAGEGKITFRGWQAGYGNVVIIQHNSHNTTLYGHMSRFASEQLGQHVAQGQTIGFVGMTGLATGPHLHYEFRIDGVHRNPLTVTTLPPDPLPNAELARFRIQTQPTLAKLKTLEATQLASAK